MKKMKRMMGIFAALAVLALGGCSDAGETSAEIEVIRGPESAASSETALTGDDAVSRAETFIEGIAPGVFGVSLRNPEPEEIDMAAKAYGALFAALPWWQKVQLILQRAFWPLKKRDFTHR